ncbi:helix-turn-helix domain-containing protein [Patescibacteria group bacterium]|nr:helix-turn-helix domain-containing protein [Patescibacteria group bacterium]
MSIERLKKINKITQEISKDLPIRADKRKTRLFIDNEYFKKGYASLFRKSVTLVYCVLAMYANKKTQTCFPSIETIMKESGIKRRNSIVDSSRVLESYNIVTIFRSKGLNPNIYSLLDPSVWKEPNSINVDTVLKNKNRPETVSENQPQQYQNQPPNSIPTDTRNHISKSYNEISNENKNPNKEALEKMRIFMEKLKKDSKIP